MGVVFTICPCLYHESMSIQWVLVSSICPCLNHESLSITWVNVYNMIPEIHITERKKKNLNFCLQKYKNINFRNTEIQFTYIYLLQKYRNTNDKIQKYKVQKCRNTIYRTTKKKFSHNLYKIWIIGELLTLLLNMNYGWIWNMVDYDLCVNMNYGWIWIMSGGTDTHAHKHTERQTGTHINTMTPPSVRAGPI